MRKTDAHNVRAGGFLCLDCWLVKAATVPAAAHCEVCRFWYCPTCWASHSHEAASTFYAAYAERRTAGDQQVVFPDLNERYAEAKRATGFQSYRPLKATERNRSRCKATPGKEFLLNKQEQFFKELTMLHCTASALHDKTEDMRGFNFPDIDWPDMLARVGSVKLMLAKMSETALALEALAKEHTLQIKDKTGGGHYVEPALVEIEEQPRTITLEQFVQKILERNWPGYANFKVAVENNEERLVTWVRSAYSGGWVGVDLFVVSRVYTNPQGLRGPTPLGAASMEHEMDRDTLASIAALVISGKQADEIEGALENEGPFPIESSGVPDQTTTYGVS